MFLILSSKAESNVLRGCHFMWLDTLIVMPLSINNQTAMVLILYCDTGEGTNCRGREEKLKTSLDREVSRVFRLCATVEQKHIETVVKLRPEMNATKGKETAKKLKKKKFSFIYLSSTFLLTS